MNVYVTLEYRTPYATVNSLWAAARQHGYAPERIVLLTPDPDGELARGVAEMLVAVQAALGLAPRVEPHRIDPSDPAAVAEIVRGIVREARAVGEKAALDVTPGRTLAKMAVYHTALTDRPDHVFYLDVPDYDYRALPYVAVPRRLQTSRDLLQEVPRRG